MLGPQLAGPAKAIVHINREAADATEIEFMASRFGRPVNGRDDHLARDGAGERAVAPKTKPAPKAVKPATPAKPAAPKAAARTNGTGSAAAKPLELKYITSHPLAAIIVRPQQLLAQPRLRMLPLEVAQAHVLDRFGFDPWQIEELIVLATVNLPQPPTSAFIVRFKAPYDREAVISHLEPLPVQGPKGVQLYCIPGTGQNPNVVLAEENTILAGPPEELSEMLARQEANSPLLDRLKKVDASGAVTVVAALEPVRGPIQLGMAQLPPLPPPLQPFLEIPELLAAIELQIRVEPELELSLVFEGATPKLARSLRDSSIGPLHWAINTSTASSRPSQSAKRRPRKSPQ